MKNAEYWRARFAILEEAAHKQSDRYLQSLEELYLEAQLSVQKEIEAWYGRFAVNNQISLSDARKLLTTGQLEEFKWTVDQYVKAAQKQNLSPEWIKKLENASARFHVSRLEAVQMQIQQQIELLYGNQVDGIDNLMRRLVSNGYTQGAFEIQKGIGLGWDITTLNQKKLDTLLSKPWTTDGKTFRDRCWTNKAELVDTVNKELIQGMLRGDSPEKAITAIQKKFGTSRYKARRLVHTETSYFNATSKLQMYRDLGVEQIEIVETLDSRTCAVCGALDGTVIPLSQYEPGVTVPPWHPNCRGTTCPHYDDMDGERAARDAEGKVYYVPNSMTYEEWKERFLHDSSQLNQDQQYGIINSKGDMAMSVDVLLDDFTPCLREKSSGKLVNTEYTAASESELKGLKKQGWKFNWLSPDLKDAKIFRLTLKDDDEIQGLVAISDFPKDSAMYVNIVESAPHNIGANKRFEGVGGHLFAIAVQESMNQGYGGFIFMDAKNEELVRHYQNALGATFLGMPHPYRMFIDENNAQKLLKIYTMNEEES